MIKAEKKEINDLLHITLTGTIDEADDLAVIIGVPTKDKVIIKCRDVKRINSVGVKNWMKYFQAVTSSGKKLFFEDVSSPLIEQLNLVKNFSCGGEVLNLMVPFSCAICNKTFEQSMKAADIVAAKFDVKPAPCAKGACSAEFDDIPEEFFSFLTKKS